MARDYAKNRQGGARKKPSPRKKTSAKSAGTGGLRIFLAGLLSGVFLSFLAYLASIQDTGRAPGETAGAGPAATTPEPSYEFYTLLPEQRYEVDIPPRAVEPAADIATPARETYLLQAGSFRTLEDADRRRAQLLLLGLEPTVQESDTDNGRWHRVYLGPFDRRGNALEARKQTAAAGIDTLLLQRGAQ
jgi:cell division protein FtsN